MTPKERFYNRLAGKPVDKIPNLNIVMQFAAQHIGAPYGKFCADYRCLVEAQQRTAIDFGIDILSTMSDPFRETHDFGARIRFPEDGLPICEEAFLTGPEDLPKLKLFDPMASARVLDRIRAVELFKRNLGDEYPVLGWVEAPFAEFCDLTTVNDAMMLLYDEPAMVEDALELIIEQEIRCANAQIAAGADVIGMGDAVASLVSPDTYRELCMAAEARVIEAAHAQGAVVKLHICGNINHILEDVIRAGADIVDIDFMVDFDRAIALSQGKCSISGHINPVNVLYQGTAEDVARRTRFCVEHGDGRSFVSGGCEAPRYTPEENLRAVDEELRRIASAGLPR